MTSGWRGNGTGNTGVTYTAEGVVFAALADNIGAVFDVPKGTVLEKAVIELVVNASSDFKTSGETFNLLHKYWMGVQLNGAVGLLMEQ